jgi:hypothetical protein
MGKRCDFGEKGCYMEVTEELEDKLNTLFVISIAVFMIIFWFLIIPSA